MWVKITKTGISPNRRVWVFYPFGYLYSILVCIGKVFCSLVFPFDDSGGIDMFVPILFTTMFTPLFSSFPMAFLGGFHV